MVLKLYYSIPCYLGKCLCYKFAFISVRVMLAMSLYVWHKTMDMHLAYGAAGRNMRMTQQWVLHHSMFMAINQQLRQTGLLNFNKHDCGQKDWPHFQVWGNGHEYGCWHTLNQHMLSWGCHECILHYCSAGNATVLAAPMSPAKRSGSEHIGLSHMAGVYSVVFPVLFEGSNDIYWREYYQQPRQPSLSRGEPTTTKEQSHQQKFSTNAWCPIVHDYLKGMNVFPASLTGPVYMNTFDSHYQNCWKMCHRHSLKDVVHAP